MTILKRWRDHYSHGSKERTSFDDMEAFVEDRVKSAQVSININVPDYVYSFPHSLGRVPETFDLTTANAPAIIYATEADRERWTDSTIVVRANQAVQGKITIY